MASSLATERRRGPVYLLIACRHVLGANLYSRTYLIELDVPVFPIEAVEVIEEEAVAIEVVEEVFILTKLRQTELVLGVTRVGDPLDAHTLVRVVARIGDVERLINVATLGILVEVLVQEVVAVESVVEEVAVVEAVEVVVVSMRHYK